MCGLAHDAQTVQHLCRDCARPLLAHYDLNPEIGSDIRATLVGGPHSLWRYRRVLPVSDASAILSLGEGCTPLLRAESLGRVIGLHALAIKDESQNPTGSFKARGMTVAISRARELGVEQLCLPSAGNAAGAAAAYAALAGMRLRAYMPADSGEGFFAECRAYGAEVVAVEGTIADCGAQMKSECPASEWFDLSTLKEPFRLEGKKTMGYELFEDYNGSLPDVIIYPTGGGTGLIGMWKAFNEMQQMGWIGDQRPKLISVQTTGCAPIVNAFDAGAETAIPITDPHTAALGLRVPGAVGDFLILRAIRETGGTAIAVTEEEWARSQSLLARHTGIFPSPEGGAALAGLQKLLGGDLIGPEDRVVVFNTGSGFKYPPATWPRS
jgi:threonine synthase